MDLLGSSAIVETAIGLALVFFLAAGLVTAVVELVASLLGFRARLLWKTVDRWFAAEDDHTADQPPNGFGGAMEMASRLTEDVGAAQSEFIAAIPGVDASTEGRRRTKQLNREAAVASLVAVEAASGSGFVTTKLGSLVTNLPPGIAGTVEGKARWLEQFFDSEMDRLSKAYRARIRWWSAFIALPVVGILGIDAIQITSDLYREPAYRQVVVAAATTAVAEGDGEACPSPTTPAGDAADDSTEEGTDEGTDQTTEEGSGDSTDDGASGGTGDDAEPDPMGDAEARLDCAEVLSEQIQGLRASRWFGGAGKPDSTGAWVTMLLGLGISAAALTAGAPFWFSVLQRLMGLRKAKSET